MSWCFILHGGCAETCPDSVRQHDVTRALQSIADTASKALTDGAKARDVVVKVVSALEDCPLFNAGHGAAMNINGTHQLEAGIVESFTSSFGAVACTETTKNPIIAANALLERGPHTMLVGPAADKLAEKLGCAPVSNTYFTTPYRQGHWIDFIQNKRGDKSAEMGTVGAIVLDSFGHLAAGGSTGGPTGKMEGRVGDTAILGAGIYVDGQLGVLCSGSGDEIFKQMVAANVAKHHALGYSLNEATRQALLGVSANGGTCAVAAMDSHGNTAIESTARIFSATQRATSATFPTSCLYPTTFPVLPFHEFYSDNQLLVGLSRYPTTLGHAYVTMKTAIDLFSLPLQAFTKCLAKVATVASVLQEYYDVQRCALVTEGDMSISILPLHGLSKDWKSVTSELQEFHEYFPGYVTSKDGPHMPTARLDEMCGKIRAVSGLSEPLNYNFLGSPSDSNLFSRIVRGELQQWRVWEDEHHVAFLTPFPNTPGFTVLVPRQHLSSDIFSLHKDRYASLMGAAHSLGQSLKSAFKVNQCAMIFEGFEIDYAHVKLIPIHRPNAPTDKGTSLVDMPFHETYQGYVTSLNGPFRRDFEPLTRAALELRKRFPVETVQPPKSWRSPPQHLGTVLEHPWYAALVTVQDALFRRSVDFFQKHLGYKYCFVPATTDAVSSPMGLGSDSEPVPIDFLGQKTYLADSMQFSLEYFLRIKDDLPGVYYVNTSFRGEDPDAMHLNQSHHIECELRGPFSEGISVAERYIVDLVSTLLRDEEAVVISAAGSSAHLTELLQHYQSHGERFPQISLDDALGLPVIDSTCWKYVLADEPSRGRTLSRAGELKLVEYFHGPVWLTEMDHLSVPFYQAFTDESRMKARCADLLLGNGETLGLGERHVQASEVLAALRQHEVEAKGYSWYTGIRDLKPILTTGWGMGIERFLAWVFQHDDIRDLTVIPRMKGHSFAP